MPITITMPALSPTMTEGVVAKWLKKEGDLVKTGDPLCEITTDKSTVEYQSIEEGFLRKIVIKEKEKALVNQGIAIITEKMEDDISNYTLEEPNLAKKSEKAEKEEKTEEQVSTPVAKSATVSGATFTPYPPKKEYVMAKEKDSIKASPLAKKIAKEKGLDLGSVKGSGPMGRILEKDLEFAKSKGFTSKTERPEKTPGTYSEEELSPMRKVIGERLQASKMMIPHYYINTVVNAGRLVNIRGQLKEAGLKFTFNDFVIKAVAVALQKYPEVNSGFNSENQTIIRFQTIDIALAVAIPDGLITPIICHADYKDIKQLSFEAKSLAKKAKEGTLQMEEYQGGSFTISNLGMYGIESFDAVINPPQAAILAIGGINEMPICQNGKIVPGHTMHLTLSLDHRVIDGADGALFLGDVKRLLENPAALLL